MKSLISKVKECSMKLLACLKGCCHCCSKKESSTKMDEDAKVDVSLEDTFPASDPTSKY